MATPHGSQKDQRVANTTFSPGLSMSMLVWLPILIGTYTTLLVRRFKNMVVQPSLQEMTTQYSLQHFSSFEPMREQEGRSSLPMSMALWLPI
jgi:hypothetical protein